MLGYGGSFEGTFELPAAHDSWQALRRSPSGNSAPGEQPAQRASSPEEQSAKEASKESEDAPDTAAVPPQAAATGQAPGQDSEPAAPPAALSAVLADVPGRPKEEQQAAGQQQEMTPAQQAAVPSAAEPTAETAEAQPPEQTASPAEATAQDAPPSTASGEEESQGTATPGAHGRHSHKGGPRGQRRRLPSPSSEGAYAGEATDVPLEAQAGGEGQQEGGGILAELEAHRHQQKQLVVEGKVRQELESMLQRIEGHFRMEQAARRRTDEALALAAGERAALRGQLEAERMQQAALLQQAMQERGMLEAQLAAISAELEQTRQESVVRLESMAAEVAAWRASAEGAAQQAEQARRELAERAAEIEGTSLKMRSLAELLAVPGSPTAPQDASLSSLAGGSPGAGRLEGLQFHRGAPGGSGGGSGGKSKSKLPHLKTRAIPGASLRQPGGEGGSPGGSPGISALPSLSPGARGLQRERSTGGGVAWAASGKAADRSAESQRDYARTAHMARWNNA